MAEPTLGHPPRSESQTRLAEQDHCNDKTCPLLQLPGEIRNKIWEYATHGTIFIRIPPYFKISEVCPGILSTNRQIRSEALPIFWHLNTFLFNLGESSDDFRKSKYLPGVNLWLHCIGANIRHLHHLIFARYDGLVKVELDLNPARGADIHVTVPYVLSQMFHAIEERHDRRWFYVVGLVPGNGRFGAEGFLMLFSKLEWMFLARDYTVPGALDMVLDMLEYMLGREVVRPGTGEELGERDSEHGLSA